MILQATSLSLSFGDNLLFSDVNFSVEAQDRIGIIGTNGSGKTTLFNLILGKFPSDAGGIVRRAGLNVGYLQQHACKDSNRSAYSEVLSVFSELIELEKELEKLNSLLEINHSDDVISRHAELNDKFIRMGGLTYKSRTAAALKGLGFSNEERSLSVKELSGGQRSKLELCRLLLSEPELLLLDEPTNHLDIESVAWLEDYISSYKGAAMIISHDRYFLDKVTNRTFSLENKKLYSVNGNYSKFREVRELAKESERREYENTMREVERIEKIIEQQRRWNREKNIKTAESKEKQIERMTKDLVAPAREESVIRPSFEIKCESVNDCLFAENISVSFPNKTLFENVTLDIKRGERVFLVGPNGCGKTTLIKKLLEDNRVKFGIGVITGYFDQHGEGVDSDKSAFSDIRDEFPYLTDTAIRSALAAYNFFGDDVFKRIGDMSGGERARVMLAKLGFKKANFLFLDEPTNHLDLPSREALENELKNFKGTLFIISHDRYFINSLATRVIELEKTGIASYDGNYDYYLEKRPPREAETDAFEKPVSENKENYLKRKAQGAEARKLKARIRNIEALVLENEQKEEELKAQLNDESVVADYKKIAEISEQIEKLEKEAESLLAEWETASEKLAGMEEA